MSSIQFKANEDGSFTAKLNKGQLRKLRDAKSIVDTLERVFPDGSGELTVESVLSSVDEDGFLGSGSPASAESDMEPPAKPNVDDDLADDE